MSILHQGWARKSSGKQVGCKKDFIIYFHCSAKVEEITDEVGNVRRIVKVTKCNTDEPITSESKNSLGMPYSKEEARRRCDSIANDPWKHLAISVVTKQQLALEEEQKESFACRLAELEDREQHIEEEVKRRVQEELDRKEKCEENGKKDRNDTK